MNPNLKKVLKPVGILAVLLLGYRFYSDHAINVEIDQNEAKKASMMAEREKAKEARAAAAKNTEAAPTAATTAAAPAPTTASASSTKASPPAPAAKPVLTADTSKAPAEKIPGEKIFGPAQPEAAKITPSEQAKVNLEFTEINGIGKKRNNYEVDPPTLAGLVKQIDGQQSKHFMLLVREWETEYGSDAVEILFQIASDTKQTQRRRYVALMGAAKLGGKRVADSIAKLLKDKDAMIRSGALIALRAAGGASEFSQVAAMMKDPALIVRMHAVRTMQAIDPLQCRPVLLESFKEKSNYSGDTPQIVPFLAVDALKESKDPAVIPDLEKVRDSIRDQTLKLRIDAAIASLRKGGAP